MGNPSYSKTPGENCDTDLSIILPCYQEAPHLFQNVARLVQILAPEPLRYELIFVDDKSTDDTRGELARISAWLQRKLVAHKVLLHNNNQGRGAAVKTGLRAAKGEIAGFLDIDLENCPSQIIPVYHRFHSENMDCVFARRVRTRPHPYWYRTLLHFGYKLLAKTLLRIPISDTEAGFKFFRRKKIVPILEKTPNDGWFWDTEIVLQAAAANLILAEHPVPFLSDSSKRSTVRAWQDSLNYLGAILDYKTRNFYKTSSPSRTPK